MSTDQRGFFDDEAVDGREYAHEEGALGRWPVVKGSSPRARARRTDPETSRDAAASFTPGHLAKNQAAVIRLFDSYGAMTDWELLERAESEGLEQSPSGLRTRRKELVTKRLVYFTGMFARRGTRNGQIWDLTRRSTGGGE